MSKTFETVIGLEVHLQLETNTKIFCSCANSFGQAPNSQTCPVCLGLPGSLPVFNKKALEYAIKVGLALNCQINTFIKFDRKNYYYPDLPKAYQISQFDNPIAKNGFVLVKASDERQQKVGITRAHLEEDAGKLIHDSDTNCSLVDYNRTGTPLIEIVTEPDIRSPQEAYDYLQTLKLILQYLDVSDCDMEKGSLRCDANISIRKKGDQKLGTKTELKNMNSFKAVKTALEFEENRQIKTIEAGQAIIQETRLWNEEKSITLAMRSKEEAHDYRYFPEPDLVPFILKDEVIEATKKALPELPGDKLNRFMQDYEISDYDANIIIQDRYLAAFFEQCTQKYKDTKKICNWINGPLMQELNTSKIPFCDLKLDCDDFVDLLKTVDDETISQLVAKDVLRIVIETKKTPSQIIDEKGLAQVSDDAALEKIVDEVLCENEGTVKQIQEGKESAIGYLVGQSMRKSKGKANPKMIGDIIKRRLLP